MSFLPRLSFPSHLSFPRRRESSEKKGRLRRRIILLDSCFRRNDGIQGFRFAAY